ncbi:MAG TPA: YajQ family cyclic di-GMP-binding protein [bacterium]|nr:YajQ family cyclic di-GMP-binding protein [bacterium]
MPSFDVVSEVDMHEVTNALDQANKEVATRFDLKNSGSKCQRDDTAITVVSDSDFHLEQVVQVLMGKMAKRNVDLKSLQSAEPVTSGKEVRQTITIRQGIDADAGRKIIKAIKDAKLKTQAAIQEDKVRVTGKKRDDLQTVIALLKQSDFGLPLQFSNFRD